MPIYTQEKLNQDILTKEVEYVANTISDIRQKEYNFIFNSEYRFIYDYHLDKLDLSFRQSILPLKGFFPKTYQYLYNQNIKYKILLMWWGIFKIKDKFNLLSFFEINQRIYLLVNPSREYDFLPNYLKDGWLKVFGGLVLSYFANTMAGTMLIGDPYSHWRAFDDYLPRAKRKAQSYIESLVQKIPYAYVDIDIDEQEKQERHRTKGFPNLRVMIDTRIPDEYPKEYDLILMCYQYDHRVFWVKDGDFIGGIYEIINPQQMLDDYFLHVFSQEDQDYTRFDFSPWANKITV